MCSRRRLAAAALIAAFLFAGCRGSSPRAAIDPELASCVPSSARIVAGIRLDDLRSSPLYARLPASARALAEPVAGASYILLALTSDGLLAAALGNFPQAPAGATLVTPRLALSGSPGAVRDATASHRAPAPAAPELLALAQPLAARYPVWIAARGSASLPLAGNLANLNNFLHSTLFTTIGIQPTDPLALDATGICRSPQAAQRLEETLRAFLSLASAASARSPVLDSIRFHTEGANLRVTAAAPLSALDPLWR